MRHPFIATMARAQTKAKVFVHVIAIVGLYGDLVYVIWNAGHVVELVSFAVLLALYHLENNPDHASQ